MSEDDFHAVSSKIDEKREFLHGISREIWDSPELGYEEVRAHAALTAALRGEGFRVEEGYILPTAFKAEYSSKEGGGPRVAVLLEYDALPEVGHACGHNLIAEAGLAAAIGIKAAMEADPAIKGELLVLGTPAEEQNGGKIDLIRGWAFEGVDAAMMVHPTNFSAACPKTLARKSVGVTFKGQEAHAAAFPWQGRNALDAAVAAYTNIALLRQQVKPECRIHAIITKGGTVPNIIPGLARLQMYVRAPTSEEMHALFERIEGCIEAGAKAAGCEVEFDEEGGSTYDNLISNAVIGEIYKGFADRMGIVELHGASDHPVGSTDMGNVSHLVPSIHPFYALPTDAPNHSRAFTEAAGAPEAQAPTLAVAKAMAMTALALMRRPGDLARAKKLHEDSSLKGFYEKVAAARKKTINVIDLLDEDKRRALGLRN